MTPQRAVLSLAEEPQPEDPEINEVADPEVDVDPDGDQPEEEQADPWESRFNELAEKIDQGFETLSKRLRKRKRRPLPASSQPSSEPEEPQQPEAPAETPAAAVDLPSRARRRRTFRLR